MQEFDLSGHNADLAWAFIDCWVLTEEDEIPAATFICEYLTRNNLPDPVCLQNIGKQAGGTTHETCYGFIVARANASGLCVGNSDSPTALLPEASARVPFSPGVVT